MSNFFTRAKAWLGNLSFPQKAAASSIVVAIVCASLLGRVSTPSAQPTQPTCCPHVNHDQSSSDGAKPKSPQSPANQPAGASTSQSPSEQPGPTLPQPVFSTEKSPELAAPIVKDPVADSTGAKGTDLEVVSRSAEVPDICRPYIDPNRVNDIVRWTVFLTNPVSGYVAIGYYDSGEIARWVEFDSHKTLTSQYLLGRLREDSSVVVFHLDATKACIGHTVYKYDYFNGHRRTLAVQHFTKDRWQDASLVITRDEDGDIQGAELSLYDNKGLPTTRTEQTLMSDTAYLSVLFDLWYSLGL